MLTTNYDPSNSRSVINPLLSQTYIKLLSLHIWMDIKFNVITHDPVLKTLLLPNGILDGRLYIGRGGAGVEIGVVAQRWALNQGYLGSISSQDSSFAKPRIALLRSPNQQRKPYTQTSTKYYQ